MPTITRGIEDLKRIRKSNALRPTRDTLREAFPGRYRERTNPRTRKKEWGFSIPLRDSDGRRTKEGKRLQEMMEPFAKSEAARARTRPARPKEALRTPSGDIVYVPAESAREHADGRGFSPLDAVNGVLATELSGEWCPRCDMRKSWCECWQTQDHGGQHGEEGRAQAAVADR